MYVETFPQNDVVKCATFSDELNIDQRVEVFRAWLSVGIARETEVQAAPEVLQNWLEQTNAVAHTCIHVWDGLPGRAQERSAFDQLIMKPN